MGKWFRKSWAKALCIAVAVIAVIILFFQLPYSVVKSGFQEDIRIFTEKSAGERGVFSEEDIAALPVLVQNHFRACGYIGTEKMLGVTTLISDAPMRESNDEMPMIIDYTLCSFTDEPVRLAYIKTDVFGIPFEGYECYKNGTGFLNGVIAKGIHLVENKGPAMDQALLTSYLSECFMLPSAVLSDAITWEPIDDSHVKATITYDHLITSGVFTFSDNGFVELFEADERARIKNDGSIDYPEWRVAYLSFKEKEGVSYADHVQILSNIDGEDIVSFDAKDIEFTFMY